MKIIRLLGFWFCLVLGLSLAALAQRTPTPVARSAPADAFSADRAMDDVRAIAQRPHPIGSTEIVRVRDHLLARINALGLEVLALPGEGVRASSGSSRTVTVGAVQNIVGILPGSDRAAPAVLVMSHYDSVHNSPGAADDAAGVAAALEIARALKAGPPLARDVIFLFTDGEEAGLLGAEAFFARDPLRQRVGMVINMEARGDAGRVAMFQTATGNGALMSLYGRAARGPTANSLAAEVYGRMPNDTDFTEALKGGLPGLNFAFIDDQLAYHTPLATPDHLEQGSLQHLGDQALPTVRALAQAATLPERTPNLIYSDLLGLVLVAYPAWAGWVLLILSALMIGFSGYRALGGKAVTGFQIARGAGGFLLMGASGALVLHLSGRLMAAGDQQRLYALLGQFNSLMLGAAALLVGVCLAVLILQARGGTRRGLSVAALAAGGLCSLVGGFDPVGLVLAVVVIALAWACLGRGVGVWGAWLGSLLVLLVLAVAVQALAPGGSVMLAWPLLAASLTCALVTAVGGTRDRRIAMVLTGFVALAAILVTAQLGAWGAWVFAGLGLGEPAILAVFALLATPALLPLAYDFAGSRWAKISAGVAAGLGVGLIAYGLLSDGTAVRPRLTSASHLADLSTGEAWRVAPASRLDAWSRVTLEDGGAKPVQRPYPPLYRDPVWMAPTRDVPIEGPGLVIQKAGDRLLIRVTPTPGAEVLTVRVKPSGPLNEARLNGRPLKLDSAPGQWSTLQYHAPDPNGVTLSFTADGPGAVEVTAVELHEGWPRGAAPPPAKPPGLMASALSDKTLVMDRAALAWTAQSDAEGLEAANP